MFFALRQGLRRAFWKGKEGVQAFVALSEALRWVGHPKRLRRADPYHLFIRLDGIGDFWLWLPFVAALQRTLSQKPFVLLANSLWQALAEETGLFFRIIAIRPELFRRSSTYRKKVLHTLLYGMPSAEVLWQTTYSRHILLEDLIAWSVPAQTRVTWQRDPLVKAPFFLSQWIDKWLYDQIHASRLPPLSHEWLRYTEWLRALHAGPLDLTIYLKIREKLALPANGSSYIAVIISAGHPYRVIPLYVMVSLIRTLYKEIRLPFYFIGTEREESYFSVLASYLEKVPYRNLVGKLSIGEAVRKLANSFMVVTPETGLGHIAATMGIPTIMVAGGGHWGRFVPYPSGSPVNLKILTYKMDCFGCGWHCGYTLRSTEAFPCIARVSVEKVAEEVSSWVSEQMGSLISGKV
ncbi:MAG: glycosyltransferase family 9 protein [Bacteroidia bacterium]|nr:hypothetical protein [Bacteroidia bacterium]MDW8133686.1 glycosyltransferase family 9 protein [Bacteroidia bacterium]